MQWRRNLTLGMLGGAFYIAAEYLWRGYSHWTMFLLGGACFVLVGGLNEWISWEMPFSLQMLAGAAVITIAEFLTGCVINLWLGWAVWDYSAEWGNLLGQTCPAFSMLWVLLSGIIILLDDWLRWKWYGEEVPRYYFF